MVGNDEARDWQSPCIPKNRVPLVKRQKPYLCQTQAIEETRVLSVERPRPCRTVLQLAR